jgi:hypothetical protein
LAREVSVVFAEVFAEELLNQRVICLTTVVCITYDVMIGISIDDGVKLLDEPLC